MEKHYIEVTDAPDIQFTGKIIGSASTTDNNAAGSSFSGQVGRWVEISLYETANDSYVCVKRSMTRWQGERDITTVKVANSIRSVINFFGHDWTAKELYHSADIDCCLDLDEI